MNLMREWTRLQASWGTPAAQPVPGSSLQPIEKTREKAADGHSVIHYNFKVLGLPGDTTYRMDFWPVGGPTNPFQTIATGVRINKEGLVVCRPDMPCGDKKQLEYPLEVAIPGAALGDTERFILVSEKNPKVFVTGIAKPFPNHSTAGTCQLEITRITPNGELLLLSGSGFPLNTKLTIKGDSAGENHLSSAQTDAQGTFLSAQLPFVVGKTSGTLAETVTAGADCHPAISAEWGEDSHRLQ